METIQLTLAKIRTWWAGVPSERRGGFLAGFALTLAALVMFFSFILRTPMVPLDHQPTDPQERSDLRDAIIAQGIRVEVLPGTNELLVPENRKAELEVQFGSSLRRNKTVGLELFDKSEFGGTRFREHTNYLRGLQGEIEKLLNQYNGVEGSKVLISMQRDALFEEDRVEPSASVLLELKPGVKLSQTEGERMARQVSGAVVGLRPERVQILDEHMRVLHGGTEPDAEHAGSGLASLQREWEGYYQRKVESLLFEMLGHGRASVRVSVQLDHAERSVYARDLDPEKVVTIAATNTEQASQGRLGARGEVGSEANLDDVPNAEESGIASSRSTERVNIDVPETKKRDVTAPGRILAVSAAVAVDGIRSTITTQVGDAEADGEAEATPPGYTPRTEAEIAYLTTLVRNALGPAAKDVSVVNHQFPDLDLTPTEATFMDRISGDAVSGIARYSIALLALLFTFGMVFRPLVQSIARTDDENADDAAATARLDDHPELPPPTGPDGEVDVQDLLSRFSAGEKFVSRADVSRLVLADVAHSVVTLQEWLNEGDEA